MPGLEFTNDAQFPSPANLTGVELVGTQAGAPVAVQAPLIVSTAVSAATSATVTARSETLGFRNQTEVLKDTAVNALADTSIFDVYNSVALANAAAANGTIPAGRVVQVSFDENNGNERSLYRRVGSASTVTRIDAASGGPARLFRLTPPVPFGGLTTGNWNRAMLVMDQPAAGTMPNGAGGNDAVNAGMWVTALNFSNDTSGLKGTYYDTVIGVGVNNDGNWGALNPGMPVLSIRMESQFNQGGAGNVLIGEYFHEFRSVDGIVCRPIATVVPFNSAHWNTGDFSTVLRGAIISFSDGGGSQRVLMDFTTGAGIIQLLDGGSGQGHPQLVFNTNNRRVASQGNAAGTDSIPLPYVRADNRLQVSQPLTRTLSMSVGATGVPSADEILVDGPVAGGYLMIAQLNTAVTGAFNYLYAVGSVSGELKATNFLNQDTGSTATLVDERTSYGDCYRRILNFTSFKTWNDGHRASDGAWCIGQGFNTLATDNAIEIMPTSRVVRFMEAMRLDTATVGSLPTPTLSLLGALVYVTDLVTPDAPGAVTGGTVECTGSRWKVVGTNQTATG